MSRHTLQRRPRGAALITAIILMGVLAMMVAALMLYVSKQRLRSVAATRALIRASCAEAGLQYARAYFGPRNAVWNNYLQRPATYNVNNPHPFNPIGSDAGTNTWPAQPLTDAGAGYIKAYAANGTVGAAMFADLDGDGWDDVYIYIRDNDDETKPAAPNWEQDSDQNVIIGSMCISKTMVPIRDGVLDRDPLLVEAILSYNSPNNAYNAQAGYGSSGTGNMNN